MDVVMPKMGESVSEGTIIKWHKKKGDPVKRDEIIFEISTDKVDTEIPSPADGVLSEIKVPEGDTVDVGTVVAVISDSGAPAVQTSAAVVQETKKQEVKEVKEPEPKKAEEVVNTQSAERTSGITGEQNIIEVTMPKMGESVMEGTVIKWYKKIGDTVKKDETLFEISTDKVDTEVPSPAGGTLAEILVGEQETVEVGTVVAKLSSSEVSIPSQSEKQLKKEVSEEKPAEPVKTASMHDNFSNTQMMEKEEVREELGFLSPLVLNIARKENISMDELKRVKGTGLEGRLTKKDLMSYLEQRKEKPVPEKQVKEAVPVKKEEKREETKGAPVPGFIPDYSKLTVSGEVERIPMDNIRQKIMHHMIASRDTSVHVSAMLEVDMSRIYNFMQKNKDEFHKKHGVKLTYMPFIAEASVKALRQYPLVNSTIEGTTILQKKFINLGIAVAIEPAGLIVPNIKNADEKNLIGLSKAIADLAARSRTKKLTPDDIMNGTFSITNYGVFGTIFGTPIINQPEVAILGVGTVAKKPVVMEIEGMDTIAVKPIMALTLSHDHRLVDGMIGGKFLKFIKDTLENFDIDNI